MTEIRPLVIVTRKLPATVETRMGELFDVEFNETDKPFTHEQLLDAVQRADVLVPTVTDRIDAEVIDAADTRLKLIASFGAGVDHIDLAAARHAGITLTNTPGVLTEDTADMAMALILSVPRRVTEANKIIRQGTWTGWAPTALLGHRINGKSLGIVGMGRIGQAIAHRARGFGMSIHYHNRRPVHPEIEAELEATHWDDLGQMLSKMDIISVNCPHTDATNRLLSRDMLKHIQPHAYIVNTSRGEVIDEAALADLLKSGKIAGAGLDVYENEPAITPELLDLDNVILLPHIGSATIEGRISMGDKVIINIQTFVDGHTPPDRVIEVII